MDRRNNGRNFRNDRRNHERNFRYRWNNERNFGNDKRNHEKNFGTNKDNGDQRNVISELREEFDEIFVKGLTIGTEEKLDDVEKGRLKLVIEFDSTKLN